MGLKVESLFKSYRKKEALKGISLELKSGAYGLLGENGAGKSTLMRILATVDFPTKGQVLYDGADIFTLDEKYRSLIGYMPQDYSVYPSFTAKDFLQYMGVLKGLTKDELKIKIPAVLDFVNLSDVANKKIKSFSGGMKRRMGIAQAILNDPEILIFDEPTAGLDPKERIRFSNIISDMSKDKIVLLSTHIVSDIEAIASNLIIISNGEILETGKIDDLVKTVRGKVWETTVDQEICDGLNKERSVIHLKQTGKNIEVRYVGDKYPGIESLSAEPTLEDYYMFISGISGKEEVKS